MERRRLQGAIPLAFVYALSVAGARETAPQFTAKTLDGETYTNDSLSGKVIVHAENTNLLAAFRPQGNPQSVLLERDGTLVQNERGGGEPWLRRVLKRVGFGQSPADATRGGGQRPSTRQTRHVDCPPGYSGPGCSTRQTKHVFPPPTPRRMRRIEQRPSTPQTEHVITPKIIEIPDGQSAPPAKLGPPTVFVLKSGERLELRRYTIMGGSLRIAADGKQRTIPLTDLDLNASTAANQERGVNLRIPTNPYEIVIGF